MVEAFFGLAPRPPTKFSANVHEPLFHPFSTPFPCRAHVLSTLPMKIITSSIIIEVDKNNLLTGTLFLDFTKKICSEEL